MMQTAIFESTINQRLRRNRVTDGELILIVDDEPANLAVLGDILQGDGYRVKVANSGHAALKLATMIPWPSLILLDVMMPDMNGYQVLASLRALKSTSDIPVIFVTSQDADRDEEHALEAGVADYIVKPVKPAAVLARVRNQLLLRRARLWLIDQNHALEAEVARRLRENEDVQLMSIRALANLAETRDNETGEHILRTQGYVKLLAERLQHHPRFQQTLTTPFIKLLAQSAPLHDIGKVGIPDQILLKPGKLTPEEWIVMQTHTVLGSEAIKSAQNNVNTQTGFLTQAQEIARWHHERWDGNGYPDHLLGDDIPVSARLMALADVFDALISKRCYKSAFPLTEVRDIIEEERGRHFDPDVAEAFLSGFDDFAAIARQHGIQT